MYAAQFTLSLPYHCLILYSLVAHVALKDAAAVVVLVRGGRSFMQCHGVVKGKNILRTHPSARGAAAVRRPAATQVPVGGA